MTSRPHFADDRETTTEARVFGGKYLVGELLGRGGMAVVHRGLDLRLGRELAIKTLLPDLACDQEFQLRFRREAKHAASLNHPAIVAVYDTGEEPGPNGEVLPYIVMEFVNGQTLRELLVAKGPLVTQRAFEIAADICVALDFSHRHGIIHRDIKPSNVMLTNTGQVKVMDFGIARTLNDSSSTVHTSTVMGTAHYMSPEQVRGEMVDTRTDVYATGCVLYELLCGQPPFVGEHPVGVAYQHIGSELRPASAINNHVTPEMDAVVLKALAKNPVDRYQSAAEMREDLLRTVGTRVKQVSAAVRGSVILRRPAYVVNERPRQGRSVLIGVLLAIVCCLVAMALVVGGRPRLGGAGAASERNNGRTASPGGSHSATATSATATLTPTARGSPTSAGITPTPKAARSSPASAASRGTPSEAVGSNSSQSTASGGGQNLTPPTAQPTHDRYLRNGVTNLCADLPGTGDGGGLDAPVLHYTCITSAPDNQKWDLIYRTTLGNEYYWIKNKTSGLCMDLSGFGAVPAGTNVSQYTCRDDDNQHWYLVWRGAGYWVVNRTTGLCLDVSGFPPALPRLNHPLTIWPCSDFDDHVWMF